MLLLYAILLFWPFIINIIGIALAIINFKRKNVVLLILSWLACIISLMGNLFYFKELMYGGFFDGVVNNIGIYLLFALLFHYHLTNAKSKKSFNLFFILKFACISLIISKLFYSILNFLQLDSEIVRWVPSIFHIFVLTVFGLNYIKNSSSTLPLKERLVEVGIILSATNLFVVISSLFTAAIAYKTIEIFNVARISILGYSILEAIIATALAYWFLNRKQKSENII